MSWRRRLATAFAGVIALTSTADARGADEVLSLQAQAMHGGFSLPAGPGPRSAACLVDTGLDQTAVDVRPGITVASAPGINATTPAAGPNGPVLHGTWMVQYASAPQDGRGMVGPTPGVPLIIVRAMSDGTQNFATDQYVSGMQRCYDVALQTGVRLAAVGLALGSDGTSPSEYQAISSAVNDLGGVPVFAASGNRPGVPQYPAAAPGVVAVAAASAVDGSRCSTSADPDAEANGVVGVGCWVTMPLDGAAKSVVTAGTSGASASLAAAVAQVCDWAGSRLSPSGCWQRVQDTASAAPAGRLPNLDAAARSLGLTPPSQTVPSATLFPPTATGTPGSGGISSGSGGVSTITIGPASGAGTTIVVATPPDWYRIGSKPRVSWSGSRLVVRSPDPTGKADLWTSLRGARTGTLRTARGVLRAGAHRVRVRARQVTADGAVYERSWSLKVPKRRPRL